ncbi:hypothetical protein [Actinoplanes aureus]|uniref:Uncharacterized protein n=1 Tax=Actinoplanes aureus TaxID=2792083 RepID=A0A931FUQ2_9ACTN|nr:hypothetical protein [Actinoplanes aureus]MBG0560473.1 hypothetical protein [Actinoplanes aureus]
MSYAVQPPVVAPPARSRPAAVTTAVVLLWTMAVVGLAYAIGMVAIAPGTIDRFRDATGDTDQVESFISVIWIDAAVALVMAVLVVALFAVLGVGLRRGSRLARGVTLGICVLGFLAGIGSLLAIAGQRAGEALPGSVGAALGAAYPNGWISLNVAVAAAQVLAYLVVAVLLLLAPRPFFASGSAASGNPPAHPHLGGYPYPAPGNWPGAPAGYGQPPAYPGPGAYPPAGWGYPAYQPQSAPVPPHSTTGDDHHTWAPPQSPPIPGPEQPTSSSEQTGEREPGSQPRD